MRILGCSSIRSDYDLLSPLYKLLRDDSEVEFKLAVSGAHLSRDFGFSFEQIEHDGLDILAKIETISAKDDSKVSRLKSASLLLSGLIEKVQDYHPDVIIYCGDREDVLVYSMLGAYLDIPTIHFYSGDHTKDGYVDNPVRHATSKLSTYHFVCLDEHAKRLRAMGESRKRIFKVGSISLDRFYNFQPMQKNEIAKSLGIDIPDQFCVVIFHPLGDKEDSSEVFESILQGLSNKNIFAFVSYPNTDPGNSSIRKVIEKYQGNEGFCFFKNLDSDLFLSIYKRSKLIIGNSSSGIYEAASVPIPAINVGLRQRGRFSGENVIFINGKNYAEVETAIDKVLAEPFQKKIETMVNPYGDGHSAVRTYEIIKSLNLKELLAKKEDPLEVNNE